MDQREPVAIIGSGNIGTDLMIKIQHHSPSLRVGMLVGIDPESDGLARARALGVATTSAGIEGLVEDPIFAQVRVVFDATSAGAHAHHDAVCRAHGKRLIDLTPAAIGPYVVPVANLDAHLDAPNINMVTCGGQATIPIVWAISQVSEVFMAEIVASISSRSAGPGTRANIDEFTVTTARGLEQVGGAAHGKAIIILNPADPPLIMRDTVYTMCAPCDTQRLAEAIQAVVARVAEYVPGYRLVQPPVFEVFTEDAPLRVPGREPRAGVKTTVLLEVEGAGDFLPAYAGNLDIMTSAARRMAELLVDSLDSVDVDMGGAR